MTRRISIKNKAQKKISTQGTVFLGSLALFGQLVETRHREVLLMLFYKKVLLGLPRVFLYFFRYPLHFSSSLCHLPPPPFLSPLPPLNGSRQWGTLFGRRRHIRRKWSKKEAHNGQRRKGRRRRSQKSIGGERDLTTKLSILFKK